MLRYPHASWRPLGRQSEEPMTGHDLVIVHTMVGHLSSTDAMFRRQGYVGTESHYGIGGRWGPDGPARLDGEVWQWQDRARRADANLDAAYHAISIETADNAPRAAADIARWTHAQATALVALISWECSREAHAQCPPEWRCHREGIPAVLVPDSRRGRRGIAYHRQGIDPWRASGGELWSTSPGKECPGPARIDQLVHEVIPAAARRVRAGGDDEVTPEDIKAIAKAVHELQDIDSGDPKNKVWSLRGSLRWLVAKARREGVELARVRADLEAQGEQLDRIERALTQR